MDLNGKSCQTFLECGWGLGDGTFWNICWSFIVIPCWPVSNYSKPDEASKQSEKLWSTIYPHEKSTVWVVKCSSLLPAVPWNKHHWFILGHHPGDRFRQISPHLKSGGCKNWCVPDCSPRPDSLDCHGLSTSFPRASTLRKSSSFDVWWKTLWIIIRCHQT